MPFHPEIETNVLRAMADRLVRYPFEVWNYGESIGIEGLQCAGSLIPDSCYSDFAYGLLRGWAARDRPHREVDNTVPGRALCAAIERTADPLLLDAAARLIEFLSARRRIRDIFVAFDQAPLAPPYGDVVLPSVDKALLENPGAGMFVDCMHLDAPFYAYFGSLVGDRGCREQGVQQALSYVDLLQDRNGLFWHFWLERTGSRYGLGWGRGQGWALLGLIDVLEHLAGDDPGRERLVTSTHRLVDALHRTQNHSGSWPAVVHNQHSGAETSTSAFVAAGVAKGIRLGILPLKFGDLAIRAWRSAWSNIDHDGGLRNVSAAVRPSTVDASYDFVPKGFIVPWGQAPMLLATKELMECCLAR